MNMLSCDELMATEHKDLNDQLCKLVENEKWEKVLEWAYDHAMSDDKLISGAVLLSYHFCIEHGLPKAAYYLAYSYYFGVDAHQDFTKAIRWAEYAADKGVIEAFSLCSDYYMREESRDIGRAFYWASLGALTYGSAECFLRLGRIKAGDFLVNQSDEEAIGYYEKALDLADSDSGNDRMKSCAQNELALIYLRNDPDHCKTEKAYMLFVEGLLSLYSGGECDFRSFLDIVKDRIEMAEEFLQE